MTTGTRMAYVELGNPNGRTLLFLHGYTDTSRSFYGLIKVLLRMNPNLRLIAPDLRGHGDSSIPNSNTENPFEIANFADDLFSFLQLKNIDIIDLVGHSMGSIIAQEMVSRHSEMINSLTMIGAFVNGKENEAIQNFLMPEVVQKWQRQLQVEFGDNWREKSYSMTPEDLGDKTLAFIKNDWVIEPDCNNDVLEAIYSETLKVPLATWFGAMEALSKIDNEGMMKQVNTPLLVIWGTGDTVTTKKDQDDILEARKNATPNSRTPVEFKAYDISESGNHRPGHNLHWANQKMVANDILKFISK
ncbi:alpha/beta fold hydrolase [Flagellimonas marina]|uniref:Alpha/beta fold hydrolase n=1 Tax=Flagellimonas marina TaxID=1775168 RepID=A0ABV8PFH1_9FLAO